MKAAIAMLIIVVVAGILGTLIARDPGYILIVYQDYSLQTSLWVGLFLVIVLVVGCYFLWGLAHTLIGFPERVSSWRDEKSKSRALQFLNKGLALSLAGQQDRAMRFLIKASEHETTQGAATLLLAQSSTDAEQRRRLWQSAMGAGKDYANAGRLGLVRDAVAGKEFAFAQESLDTLPLNGATTLLKLDLFLKMGNWKDLAALSKDLGKYDVILTQDHKNSLRLALAGMQTDTERHLWRSALSILQGDDEAFLIAYCRHLSDPDIAEKVLRQEIDKRPSQALFIAYADLGQTNLPIRLKQMGSWSRKFADDAGYRCCAGTLYYLSGKAELALAEYQKSLELGTSAELHNRMALLLADTGDHEASMEQFKLALKVVS
jgi:HemY protein